MSDPKDQQEETAGQPDPNEGKDGFGAAFAERSSDLGQQASETQLDDDESSDLEPAPAGSTEAPAPAAAQETGSGTEASAFDPFAGLTPEQKSHFERLQASDRSNRGRVSALTRKLNGTTAQAAPAPQAKTEQGTNEGSGGEEATVSDLDKRLQTAVDEYGDVVGPIAEILKDVRAEIAAIKGTVSAAEEEVSAQELEIAYEDLQAVHADALDLAEDPNFIAWIGDQPKQVIELANSFDPREVSLVLTLFKTERSAATASPTGAGSDTGHKESTATDAKRQRQLEGSKVIPNRGAPAAAGTPNDFRSAFKARTQAIAAERR